MYFLVDGPITGGLMRKFTVSVLVCDPEARGKLAANKFTHFC